MRYGKYLDTALGRLYIEEENGALVRLTGAWEKTEEPGQKASSRVRGARRADGEVLEVRLEDTPLLQKTESQVLEFIDGRRTGFTVPVHMEGTAFQRRVWEALQRIPYGETRTYGQIANQVGCPGGARAVGMACNRNPIMLIVPCHRVVGADGGLVGFGGGLPMKEALLALEGAAISKAKKRNQP